ncbi:MULTISPECIES: Arc family DNA-binding protein [Gilliamella]|uniref:Arc family DNA-binding protein n=1 Tax=Gilliamella TaxID=1193503 RepID=UPI0011474A1C|nr:MULTISPECIES: Arc family DNA-binding protein [Gilliamella]MCO6551001.1 Arc family DNA-binding protein [Gilliamella sp.]
MKENKVTLSARMPVSLKAALEVLAAMNDRTMSQELVNRVRQSLTEEEKKIAGI